MGEGSDGGGVVVVGERTEWGRELKFKSLKQLCVKLLIGDICQRFYFLYVHGSPQTIYSHAKSIQ